MKQKFLYIDLFAGCGGLSLGLHNAGWEGLFAIEKSKDAFETLEHNLIKRLEHYPKWPKWLKKEEHDINEVIDTHYDRLKKLRGKVHLVAGGPPCQGFSMAGRRKEDDARNDLIRSYLRFIMLVRPKIIFFENVKGFTQEFKKNKSKGKAYSEYVLRVLKFFGYDVEGKMVNFARYGIPQKRTRFILVAIRKDKGKKNKMMAKQFFSLLWRNKKKFLSQKNLPQNPKLYDAISDLLKSNGLVPTPDRGKRFNNGLYGAVQSTYQAYLRAGNTSDTPNSHSFPKHRNDIEQRFLYLLKNQRANKNISDEVRTELGLNKHTIIPLSKLQKAPTITTLPDDYIHYKEPRILTVREYARIQSFPDNYELQGKYTTGGKLRTKEVPRYTQIGNAIPPLFGEQSGIALKQLL